MSQPFNVERASYILQQTPISLYPNKTFTLMGFVSDINLEIDFSIITIIVITFRNKSEIKESFDVYFQNEVRSFVDKYAKIGDLAHVTGEIIISKDSTDKLQVIKLSAKHAYLYRKYSTSYAQISEIIKAEETNNEDLAF